jgi:hypothetical protein
LGIGDWGLGPIPNPQSPIPNPQSPIPKLILFYLNDKNKINLKTNIFDKSALIYLNNKFINSQFKKCPKKMNMMIQIIQTLIMKQKQKVKV